MATQKLKFIERALTITRAPDDNGVFEGYASLFDVEDSHGDTVKRGAFKKSLKATRDAGRFVPILWQHDRHNPIGKYLEMEEDSRGLAFQGKLTLAVRQAEEAYALMKDDVLSGISIGGYVRKRTVDEKTYKQDFHEIELLEASLVTFPALDKARVSVVKSLENLSEIEANLRDVGGYSVKEAKTIISLIRNAKGPRDVDMRVLQKLQNTINSM